MMAKRLRVWYSKYPGRYSFGFPCIVGRLRITCFDTEEEAKQWVADVNKKTDEELVKLVKDASAAFKKFTEDNEVKDNENKLHTS